MKRLFAVAVLLLSLSVSALGDEVTVAAASDLNFAMKEIVPAFEKKSGHKVRLSLGSSGNFFSQIQNGAPFDVFFSADIDYPRRLEQAGLTETNTLFMYAIGRVVIWTRKDSGIDVQKGMQALLDPRVRKIAIANPKHAPYGRAAKAAMEAAKSWEKLQEKVVFGENISQTAQFVESGNADIGIIALSLASAPAMQGKGNYWVIPEDQHPRLEQAAVVIKASQHIAAAKQFLEFMKSEEASALLRKYGFVLPEAKPAAAAGKDSKKK